MLNIKLLLPVLCLLIVACGESIHSLYPITDSDFIARSGGRSVWLDNDRVLFEGHAGEKPKTDAERKKIKLGLFLWDTRSNKVTLYAEGGRHVCFQNNYISYLVPTIDPINAVPNNRRFDRIAGNLGEEVNMSERERQEGMEVSALTRSISCKNIKIPPFITLDERGFFSILSTYPQKLIRLLRLFSRLVLPCLLPMNRLESQRQNHPKPGASIKVEPIPSLNFIAKIKAHIAHQPRNLCLFIMGINTAYRASELLALKVGQVQHLKAISVEARP